VGVPLAETIPVPTDTLTLRQAQMLAMQHNPQLAAFGWEVRTGEARTLQAGLAPNPEVRIEIENFAGSRDLRGFEGAEMTIFLSQEIEVAGKRRKRIHVAAFERDLTAWDYEAARLDVLTQVTRAFVDVLSLQERLELHEELVRLAEQVVRTATERVRAGKVSPIEETKARLVLSQTRITQAHTQRELAGARTRLVTVWGGSGPAFARVQGELEVVTAIPTVEQITEHLIQNPVIARWATAMAQRQAAVQLEEARRIPNPSLGAGFRYFNETDDKALVMEVSMPLPIFARNQGNLLAARHQLAKADAERRAAETEVQAHLAETYTALSAAFTDITRLQHEVLPDAQHAFAAIGEGYRQGKFGILEVLDAQRTLFEARGQHIDALTAYHQARIAVERLIGKPLIMITTTITKP
jgi:cobalt-zinc-cadmium efflux system outer membrane protein